MKFAKVKCGSASALGGNIQLVTSGAGPGRGGEMAIKRVSAEALEESRPSPEVGAGNIFILGCVRSKIKR